MRKLSIFISYASEDKLQVRELVKRLSSDGFVPWFDENNLLPGQDWKLEIENAVEKADVVIVCLSNSSVTKKGFVQSEIKKVIRVAEEYPEGAIYIIPVRLENCLVPKSFSGKQYIDIFRSGSYEKLIHALKYKANESGIDIQPEKIQNIEGTYIAIGINSNGIEYQGRVIISREGNKYNILWYIGRDSWEAMGTLTGNKLYVKGDYNFYYELKEDGILYGEWKPGAKEKLIPQFFNT